MPFKWCFNGEPMNAAQGSFVIFQGVHTTHVIPKLSYRFVIFQDGGGGGGGGVFGDTIVELSAQCG